MKRLIAWALPFLLLPGHAVARPSNVVVIVADDAGYADFGFQGSPEAQTPHLDSIAARGVRFTQAYVTASTCSPSRAGLLTGRYQQRFGHEQNISRWASADAGLPVGERTLADLLQIAGYRNIAVGKWHLGSGTPAAPGDDPFDGRRRGPRGGGPRRGERSG
jgi:arylsulfatase A-like enzyme